MERIKLFCKKIREWICSHIALSTVIMGALVIIIVTTTVLAVKSGSKSDSPKYASSETSGEDVVLNNATSSDESDQENETDKAGNKTTESGSETTLENGATVEGESGAIIANGDSGVPASPQNNSGTGSSSAQTPTKAPVQTPAKTPTSEPAKTPAQTPTPAPAKTPTSTVSTDEKAFKEDGGKYVVSGSTVTITSGGSASGAVVVPATIDGKKVAKIEDEAYCSNDNIKSVTINCEVISADVFVGCDNLTSVFIGTNVKSIGSGAFIGCPISSIVIPDSVTYIGEYAFSGCMNLSSVKLGNGVKELKLGVFSHTPKLTNITIPSSVVKFETSAFGGSSEYGGLACTPHLNLTVNNNKNNINIYCSFDPSISGHDLEQYINDDYYGRGNVTVRYTK